MKNKNLIYYVLMFLPIVVVLIGLPLLPDMIPAHYNMAGEMDRLGSKYESLILPLINIGMGVTLLISTRINRKKAKENGENNQYVKNEKVNYYMGIAVLLVFNVMTYVFLYKSFAEISGTISSSSNVEINKVVSIVIGISLVIIGNILPKCKRNSFIGLRTPWSMSNDRAWAMSQKIGGISFIITGIIIIVANSFFVSNENSMLLLLSLIILDGIFGVAYSYYAYKKTENLN